MDLKNYVAVITGGASGIGEATVRLFVERGAQVVIADLDEARGRALEEQLNGKAVFCRTDVSDSAQVKALFDMVEEKYGVVDVLFNNAAYSLSKTLWDTTEEEWDKVMRVNLKGYFLCAKYALPLLKKSGHGAIICTGSELGIVGCVESLAYNSSKGGVIQFAKSLALELAPFGIRVNVVCPSGTETPAFVKDMSRSGNYEGEVKRLVASYPLKRLGQPIDIAYAVAFLASEEASFITGTHLMVDGGFTAQ
ncbi:MAG TPA: SDR family oxidoreductase [Candidatus Ruthenibacterium merdigallinarum]|nr:SDR family oxidoreductase [Candidatus Ruthenibacterium merdigallinarum]